MPMAPAEESSVTSTASRGPREESSMPISYSASGETRSTSAGPGRPSRFSARTTGRGSADAQGKYAFRWRQRLRKATKASRRSDWCFANGHLGIVWSAVQLFEAVQKNDRQSILNLGERVSAPLLGLELKGAVFGPAPSRSLLATRAVYMDSGPCRNHTLCPHLRLRLRTNRGRPRSLWEHSGSPPPAGTPLVAARRDSQR